jgi:rare lipoprotein A
MRSFVDAVSRVLALGLASAALSGCGLLGGSDRPESLAVASAGPARADSGPAADYPIVLGEPFTVEGELYTPADTLNYDAVGYAAADDGAGVTAAHRTLPLPSYAEVTSLETGKTILVRIERRGPMIGKSLVALSSAALEHLGAGEGAAVRLRRVNPPEAHRAELRAGRPAPERIETPKSLVEVLRRKLPPSGAANLRTAAGTRHAVPSPAAGTAPRAEPVPAASAAPAGNSSARPVAAYPLPRLDGAAPAPRPVVVARAQPEPVAYRLPAAQQVTPAQAVKTPKPSVPPASSVSGAFVIQAGAFANEANAQRAAKALGGFVSQAGRLFRVRTGPFPSRGQAEAALAKVRAAGYSDARVTTAG